MTQQLRRSKSNTRPTWRKYTGKNQRAKQNQHRPSPHHFLPRRHTCSTKTPPTQQLTTAADPQKATAPSAVKISWPLATLHSAERDADGVSTRIVFTCAVLHERRMKGSDWSVQSVSWSLTMTRYYMGGCVLLMSVAVARNGPTEMVLLLLLCCGGNARVLLALVAWILILVTRAVAVQAQI